MHSWHQFLQFCINELSKIT